MKTCRTSIEHLSNIDRTSIKHLSNIDRKSIENLSNIYRTSIGKSIEDLANICRKSVEHLSKIHRKSTEHPPNIHRKSIENPLNILRKSTEHEGYWGPKVPKEAARRPLVAIIYTFGWFLRCKGRGRGKLRGGRRQAARWPQGGRRDTMTPWLALPTKYFVLRSKNEVMRICYSSSHFC